MKTFYKYLKTVELYIRSSFPFGFVENSGNLFFPGCSLSSSNPKLVKDIYKYLKKRDKSIGLWSACCGRPLSQFVGRESALGFQEYLLNKVSNNKKLSIVTACGNCFTEFKSISKKKLTLNVTSLYDILSEEEWLVEHKEAMHVHHPCPARTDRDFSEGFEKLINQSNIKIKEQTMNNHSLSCCLSKSENAIKKIDNNRENKFVTYCAHCVKTFQKQIEMRHILQILFNDSKVWKRKGLFSQLVNLLKLKIN